MFSFTPDRRAQQKNYYQYSGRSRDFTRDGLSELEGVKASLGRIYRNLGIPDENSVVLIDQLVTYVPIAHQNLTMLAVANKLAYDSIHENKDLDRYMLDKYYNFYLNHIVVDIIHKEGKQTKDEKTLVANFKVTLLRYAIYIINHVKPPPA